MENNSRLYPLTIAQKNQLYFYNRYSQTNLFNQGISLSFDCNANEEVLRESILEAIARCESMRIRFSRTPDGEVMQYINNEEAPVIETVDFSMLADFEAENKMKEWTAEPFTVFEKPVNRVVIVSLAENVKAVFLLYHLMALDRQAASQFLSDVAKIYGSKTLGAEYPKMTTSYLSAVEKDIQYQASNAYQEDKSYWFDFMAKSEAYYADIRGPKALSLERRYRNYPFLRACVNTAKSPETLVSRFHLEKEPTQRIINFCEHHKISVDSFLKMGLRTYISKMNYNQSDISIINSIPRRDTNEDLLSGGQRTHYFPCRSVINSEEIFIDAVKKVEKNHRDNLEHANFDTMEFWHMRAEHYHNSTSQAYECMTFAYQPTGLRGEFPSQLRCRLNSYSSGAALASLRLDVTHRIEDNGLDFDFTYQKNRLEPQEINSIYYYLCKILFASIENCYATIGEIISRV